MAEITEKLFKVSDLYLLISGDKISDIKPNPTKTHTVPVYGTADKPVGYTQKASYNKPTLVYTINGNNSGQLKIIEGTFSINGGLCAIIPKSSEIDLYYSYMVLRDKILDKVKEAQVKTVTKEDICSIEVPIPVNEKGEYLKQVQEEKAKKVKKVLDLRKELLALSDRLHPVSPLEIIQGHNLKMVKVKELLNVKVGSTKLSAKYIKDNPGEYPVYSAAREVFGYTSTYMFSKPTLHMIALSPTAECYVDYSPFSVSQGRLYFEPKNPDYAIEYFKYILPEYYYKYTAKGVMWRVLSSKLEDTEIPVPCDDSGNISGEKMRELSEKMLKLDNMYKVTSEKLKEMLTLTPF